MSSVTKKHLSVDKKIKVFLSYQMYACAFSDSDKSDKRVRRTSVPFVTVTSAQGARQAAKLRVAAEAARRAEA